MPPEAIRNEPDPASPIQVFHIIDTDNEHRGTIKVETQKDSFGSTVVYWSDLVHLREDALYLKDREGKIASFIKDETGEA